MMAAASTTDPSSPQLVKQAELVQLLRLLNVRSVSLSVALLQQHIAACPKQSLPSSLC